MQSKIRYDFSGKLWRHQGEGGWHFISLPVQVSKEIRENLQWQEEGWGRMKATAVISNIEWDSAIWFDKKHGTYLLPVKADIRKKAKLQIDQEVEVHIFI